MLKRSLLLTLGLAAAVLIQAGSVRAQTIQVAGSTTGTFGSSGTNVSHGLLTYTSTPGGTGSFDVTTSNGFAAIGNGSFLFNNFGTLSLADGTANFVGETLNLVVTFTLPAGTTPNPHTYTGLFTGNVNPGTGGASIISWSAPQTFTFTGGLGGSFVLGLDTRSVTNGQDGAITGRILGVTLPPTPTPEPATLALLLPAFAPAGLLLRRRSPRA